MIVKLVPRTFPCTCGKITPATLAACSGISMSLNYPGQCRYVINCLWTINIIKNCWFRYWQVVVVVVVGICICMCANFNASSSHFIDDRTAQIHLYFIDSTRSNFQGQGHYPKKFATSALTTNKSPISIYFQSCFPESCDFNIKQRPQLCVWGVKNEGLG
jgi:hypothetical protein